MRHAPWVVVAVVALAAVTAQASILDPSFVETTVVNAGPLDGATGMA